MLAFHFPERLWALVLVPALALLFFGFRRWQRARLRGLADAPLQSGLWPGGPPPVVRPALAALPLLALALLIGAAAGLYEPAGATRPPAKGVDVLLVLDLSRSMHARDVQPSRLDRALSFMRRLADRLEDDRVGLIVFAGRPYLQTPITTDRGALRLALQSATPESVPTQGTAILPALSMAARSFPQNLRRSRVVVLVSDGEDHDESASDAAVLLRRQGVQLLVLGVGTPEGAGLLQADGLPKTDPDGKQVISKLEEASLQSLARETGGGYSRLQDAVADADRVAAEIRALPGSYLPAGKGEEAAAREYFPYFAGAALALLVMHRLLSSGRRRRKTPIIAGVLLVLLTAQGAAAQNAWQEGTRLYREGKFGPAAEAFERALRDSSAAAAAAQYNLGNALYKKGDFAGAAKAFGEAARQVQGANGDAAYNKGNSYAAQKQWKEALQAYQEALRAQPGAADAQRNYAYARKQLQKQQQEEKEKKEKEQDDQREQQQPQRPEEAEQQKPSNLTPEQAEKMLQALRQEEQKIADRQRGTQDTPPPSGKDW